MSYPWRYLVGSPSSRFAVVWDGWGIWRLHTDHVSLGRLVIWWKR